MAKHGKRLDVFDYSTLFKKNLGGSYDKIFSGELVYPRQIEFQLPGDHKTACNFGCYYCQGALVKQPLVPYEPKALKVMNEIGPGKTEYYIFGGAYTEPLLNPYLLDFLKATKRNDASFDLRTNGSLFKKMEKDSGFLTETFSMMKKRDYVSVSLDAGTPESHMKTKCTDYNWFDDIIDGLAIMTKLRDQNPERPAVRVTYLLNKRNSSDQEIRKIVSILEDLKVDSCRFSIPYDVYGKPFDTVRRYKNDVEIPFNNICELKMEPYISASKDEKPYIFYYPPSNQDVDRMNYRYCVYTYYQITAGADGNVYRCSSIASPTFSHGILGPMPDNKEDFEKLMRKGQEPNFHCDQCFRVGARCNRFALEVNDAFNRECKGQPVKS